MGSAYSLVCMLESLGSLALFITGLCRMDLWPPLWYVSLIFYFTHTFLNELLLTLKGWCCKHRIKVKPTYLADRAAIYQCLPIVYSPTYNIHAFGIEKLHPFDASKYKRVFEYITAENGCINLKLVKLHRPMLPSREFLQEIMSKTYLLSLNYTYYICKAVEMPIPLPGWLLRQRLLEPMQCASVGSVEAAMMALKHKWAINLGGGYHHATQCQGGGFCIYPDITMITHYLELWCGLKKFMIIDLDAHQGNGHERDHTNRLKYYIIDAYNHAIYPGDELAAQSIQDDLRVTRFTTDDEFCHMI